MEIIAERGDEGAYAWASLARLPLCDAPSGAALAASDVRRPGTDPHWNHKFDGRLLGCHTAFAFVIHAARGIGVNVLGELG